MRLLIAALYLTFVGFLGTGCGSDSDSNFEPNPKYEREIQEQALDSIPIIKDSL